jgi:pimeloyl-ACP methyl ester carboxylesterase
MSTESSAGPSTHVLHRDDTDLAWYSWGAPEGVPVVLQHGFAASTHSNWVSPGVVGDLVEGGRWVIGIDARGHGQSQSVHDPMRVGHARAAQDISALIDHLERVHGTSTVDYAGYSMGGHIGLHVLCSEPRVRRGVIAAIGALMPAPSTDPGEAPHRINRTAIAEAMERTVREPDLDLKTEYPDPDVRAFVRFARFSGADLLSLAAHMRAPSEPPGDLSRITADVLVIAGQNDHLAVNAEVLARLIPGAEMVRTPGDHLSAVAEPEFRTAVRTFLCR